MAVSNQDIIDFLLANPGMSDADIGAAMAQYGVSPAQMANATGLSEGEVTSRLAATLAPNQATLFGDTYVQPIYTQLGSGMDAQQGPLENVVTYKATDNKTGGNVNWYDPTGAYQQTTQQQKVPSFLGGLADVANDPFVQAALLASGAGGAIGNALGLTGSTAQAVGTGLLKGGSAAAGGASLSDALKTGLLSGGLVYGGNELANAFKYRDVPVDFTNMTQDQINDALDVNFRNDLARAGLTDAQIKSYLANPSGVFDVNATIPTAVSTPVTDAGTVSVAAPTTTTTALPVITAPVTNAGSVNVTGTAQPQQIDQSVMNLINSQLATNVKTPTTLANVQVTGDKGLMSNADTTNAILSTLAGNVITPTQTITGQKPATTQEIVNAITSTLPTVTPTQAATVAEQIITSGKPVTTQEVINAITAALPTVTTPTTTTVPNQVITAQKPSSINDVVTAATIPLIQPSTPLTPTPVTSTNNTLGLTDDQITNLLKAGLGLFGTLGATSALSGGGTTVNPAGLPTQTPPMYTDDYFTKVQQNYNRILPAVPRDVATPLRDWYTSQYGA